MRKLYLESKNHPLNHKFMAVFPPQKENKEQKNGKEG